MRLKDHYALELDELGVPMPEMSVAVSESGASLPQVRGKFLESLNIGKAFSNYIVQRNRTKDLGRQIAAMEGALYARNREAERESEIIIANYSVRLKEFLDKQTAEMERLTEKLELEAVAIVEQVQNERQKQQAQLKLTTKLLRQYSEYVAQMQKFLAEIESSPEKYVTKNRCYFQVQEDCRVKMREISRLLKNIDGGDNNG